MQRGPDNTMLHYGLGLATIRKGDLDAAIGELESAVKGCPCDAAGCGVGKAEHSSWRPFTEAEKPPAGC